MREAPLPLPNPTPQTRRLHISPFNPSLLPIVLAPPILQNATLISYHEIQTFPERNYGYVTLPIADAEKIIKKLNGWILKGAKMKVTEARAEKKSKRKHEEADEEDDHSDKKKARKSKSEGKSTREEGVLPGVELPKERNVKRGWTEPEEEGVKKKVNKDKNEKKVKTKSSYTNEPELLFKTTVPPNAAPVGNGSSSTKKEKRHKKGKADREVTVHEFTNTTKQPAFLRDEKASQKSNGTSEYVDGKGWVDSNGEVLEDEPQNVKTKNGTRRGRPKKSEFEDAPVPTIAVSKSKSRTKAAPVDDETSSSGSSSPSSSSSTSPHLNRLSITRSSATPPPAPLPRVTTTSPPNSPPASPPTSQPHPLETLFKRPAPPTSTPTSQSKSKPNLEVSTSFRFLDDENDDPGAMTAALMPPRTPATQMDIRNRRQRSAAPTPDTAMPGKSFWTGGNGRRSESLESGDVSDGGLPNLGEAEADEEDAVVAGLEEKADVGQKGEKREESAFRKNFYEKRGENNRSAKKRVREAKKEKRQKENKRRG